MHRASAIGARITASVFIFAVASCSSDPPSHAVSTVVRDSAGTRIVESRKAEAEWELPDRWIAEIGGAENDSTQLLNAVVSAVWLSDGRVVIANGAAPLLRWYERSGRLVHSSGRIGNGPGEFGGEGIGVGGIWRLSADSIAAWDLLHRRMQVFDSAGVFVRAFGLQRPPGWQGVFSPRIVGVRAGGSVIAALNPSITPPATDVWRDTVQYMEWTSEGQYHSALLRLPGAESYTPTYQQKVRQNVAAKADQPPPPPAPLPPFVGVGLAAATSDGLYYTTGDRNVIVAYDSTARTRQLNRRVVQRRAVTQSMKDGYARQMLDRAGANVKLRQEFTRWLDAALYPDSLPAYRRLLIASDGALWAQEYDAPDAALVTWSVFGPDGSWLSRVNVPAGLRILAVDRNAVVALARDELDVESVRIYLIR